MRSVILVLFIALSFGSVQTLAFAKESLEVRAKDKVGDIKTDAKKTVRDAKRKVRKMTGTNTVVDTAKDRATDTKEEINNLVKKIDNRLDE